MSFVGDLFSGGKQKTTTSAQPTVLDPIPFALDTGRSSLTIDPGSAARTVTRQVPLSAQVPGSASSFNTPLSRLSPIFRMPAFAGLVSGPSSAAQRFGGFQTITERIPGRLARASLNLDPSIQAGLDQNALLAQGFLGETGGFLDRIRSNQNPFIEARVRPLEERLGGFLGAAQRDFGRRNIAGSIATNQLADLERRAGREIGDARSLATQDALSAELQGFGLQGQALDRVRQSIIDQLTKELSALGISQNAINQFINSRQIAGGTQTATTRGGGDPLGSIGALLSGAGIFMGAPGVT